MAHLLELDGTHHLLRELVLHDNVCSQVALERNDGNLDAGTVVSNLVDPLRKVQSGRDGWSSVSKAGCSGALCRGALMGCERTLASMFSRELG